MSVDFTPLREWLKSNDCNQGELAQLLDISQGHLSAVLAGKRTMTLEQAIRASVITGLPAERLCSDPDSLRFLKLYIIRQRRAA